MDWIKEMIFEMDWKQFIPSLVATIIGIFGPFWIQSRIEKSKQKKDALEKVKQLKSELRTMLNTIKDLKDDEERYIDPVKTPVWTGMQNTNESSLLSVLRKKPKADKKNKKRNNSEESLSDNETSQKDKVIVAELMVVASDNVVTEPNEKLLVQANLDTIQSDIAYKDEVQSDNWYKAVYSLYGQIEEYNKWWNLYSTQRAAGRETKVLHNEKACIAKVKEKLCSYKLKNEEEIEEINKDGIPYLLQLLDDVIAVNTPTMRQFLNWLRKIFKSKTNKQKSK